MPLICNNPVFLSEKAERKKYLASRLPSTWPSHLHNKCNVQTCYYPNSPQAAEGTYNCLGSWRGVPCRGTYYVSLSTAKAVVQRHRYEIKLQDDAKWRTKKVAEIEAQKDAMAEFDEKARRRAPEDLAAYYEERKIKNVSPTSSTTDDLNSSAYLARRAAQQRRPTDTKPTNLITKQLQRAFSPSNRYCPTLYPPAVNNYSRIPVDLDQSAQMPPQMSSRFHSSKSTTEYLSYEYNPPRLPSRSVL